MRARPNTLAIKKRSVRILARKYAKQLSSKVVREKFTYHMRTKTPAPSRQNNIIVYDACVCVLIGERYSNRDRRNARPQFHARSLESYKAADSSVSRLAGPGLLLATFVSDGHIESALGLTHNPYSVCVAV